MTVARRISVIRRLLRRTVIGILVMANGDTGDAVIEKLLFGDMMVPVLETKCLRKAL